MNQALIAQLRDRVENATVTADHDFYPLAESAGLLCGLTDEPLAPSLAQFVRAHDDVSALLIEGLREVEHTFEEAAGEDMALAVILTQKWVLLVHAVSLALKAGGGRLSPRCWEYLQALERLACQAELTEGAVIALMQWRSHTQLAAEKQIAAVSTILSGAEQGLLDVLGRHHDQASTGYKPLNEYMRVAEEEARFAYAARTMDKRTTSEDPVSGLLFDVVVTGSSLNVVVRPQERAAEVVFVRVGEHYLHPLAADAFVLDEADQLKALPAYVVINVVFRDGRTAAIDLGRKEPE